jgi:release factor glutamine methyltransferase
LRLAGIDNPRLEARLLLAHVLGTSQAELLRDRSAQVEPNIFAILIYRRAAREPLALILGKREFWSLNIAVSSATLIPRPDSETLIEAAVAAFADRPPPARVLDLGTGTGCLLLAALAEFPASFGIGVDRAPAAVVLAADNASRLGMAERAAFLRGDWADALNARFDLILCNPPYIPSAAIAGLMPEVARHEPRSALDGGADGLDVYRCLLPDLHRLLSTQGVAVVELGAGQAGAVAKMAQDAGFATAQRQDLSGIARALVLQPASP